MKKKKLFVTLAFAVIILGIIGWQIYEAIKLRYSDAWKDAHPAKEQVDKWLIKNFDPPSQGFGEADPNGYKVWNKNPKFEGPNFDTGYVSNQATHLTPFGDDDWGVGGYAWGYKEYEKISRTYLVESSRIQKKNDAIYIFVKHHKKGQYGVGNILQGWIHKKPPPFNHRKPNPLETADRRIILSFDLKIKEAKVECSKPDAWQFVGTTIWFRSEQLKKPLVIDLIIYTNSEILYSKNAENAYRYQKVVVADKRKAIGRWRHYDIDVSWFIADMLKRFNIEYAAGTLKFYSLEILCETMFGECGFYTRNVYLYYK